MTEQALGPQRRAAAWTRHRTTTRPSCTAWAMPRNCCAACALPELRHFLLDHLHPVGRHQLLRPGAEQRRRRVDRHRLAARLPRLARLRARHGADRLGLSDGGRALPLGLDPRRTRPRLAHGLVQPARPRHGAGRHQCRHLPVSRRALFPYLGIDTAALTPADADRHLRAGPDRVVGLITVSQALFNHLGIRLTSKLTDISGYLIFGVACADRGTAGLRAASRRRPAREFQELFGRCRRGRVAAVRQSRLPVPAGLLLPAYTITGFDASAHTAEETIGAARAIPRGMIHSVFWSGLFGWLMLCGHRDGGAGSGQRRRRRARGLLLDHGRRRAGLAEDPALPRHRGRSISLRPRHASPRPAG